MPDPCTGETSAIEFVNIDAMTLELTAGPLHARHRPFGTLADLSKYDPIRDGTPRVREIIIGKRTMVPNDTTATETTTPSSHKEGSGSAIHPEMDTGRYAPLPTNELERVARLLETSDQYRVLRRLKPRPVVAHHTARCDGIRIGIVLDTETTGLDQGRDEVIELAMIKFTYDKDRILEIVGTFEGFQQPKSPIGSGIVALTGITDEMLQGRMIDPEEIEDFVRSADLIVAHNARFDRPFCERSWPVFRSKSWGCSMADVDWRKLGVEGARLSHILNAIGFFHSGHRALVDCHAVLEILSTEPPRGDTSAFASLLQATARATVEVSAEKAPFHMKDVLKLRRYRWSDGSDGRPKAWRLTVDENDLDAETAFLRSEVYGQGGKPVLRRIKADERYANR